MTRRGVGYALAAYVLWGLLPIYWKLLQSVDSLEILMHRMVWSLLFLAVILTIRRRWKWIGPALRDFRLISLFVGAALLLGTNWGLYIWAVNAGYIVETSLGYYITPLFNVLFGLIFFQERLRFWQWGAILIAACGVVYLTISYGHLPWIALGLALSFSLYGVLKKKAPLGSFEGLTLETAVLFIPALVYILIVQISGQGALGRVDGLTQVLLVLTGVATAIPLLFFASAARSIPLTWIGIIQYISPTLSMLIGVFLYKEPFGPVRQVGFIIIGIALLVFSVENILQSRHRRIHRRMHAPSTVELKD